MTTNVIVTKDMLEFARTAKIHLGFSARLIVDHVEYDEAMSKIIRHAIASVVAERDKMLAEKEDLLQVLKSLVRHDRADDIRNGITDHCLELQTAIDLIAVHTKSNTVKP